MDALVVDRGLSGSRGGNEDEDEEMPSAEDEARARRLCVGTTTVQQLALDREEDEVEAVEEDEYAEDGGNERNWESALWDHGDDHLGVGNSTVEQGEAGDEPGGHDAARAMDEGLVGVLEGDKNVFHGG